MTTGTEVAGATLYRWADIPPEQLNPFFTRQFVNGEQAMLAKVALKKGCVVPTHHHPNEQISLIVSGSLEFVLDGQSVTVHTGEILIIPAGVPHSAIAHEDMEGLDIFAPPRQDWLNKTDAYLRQDS